MSAASPQLEEPSTEQLRAGLNTVVRDMLRPAALALVIAYGCFSLAHPFILPAESNAVMTGMAIGTFLVSLGLYAAIVRRDIPPEKSHVWASAMLAMVTLNLGVHFALTPGPELIGNLIMLLIAVGCFVLAIGWFLLGIGACLAVWAMGVFFNPDADWWATSHLVVVGVLVSVFIFWIRRQTYGQYERTRLKLEAATNRLESRLHFEHALTEISAEFLAIANDRMEAAIEKALGTVGKLLEVDHACICQVDPGDQNFHLRHEWCALGIHPRKPDMQNFPVSRLAWCWQRIGSRQMVRISRLSEFPAEANGDREFFERAGIRSISTVPLTGANRVWGMLVLVTERRETIWPEDAANLLTVFGEIIVAAVHQKEAGEEIADLNLRLEQASRLVSLGELAASLAHDLTNGLSAISLQTKAAERKSARNRLSLEDSQEYIHDIAEQSDRLLQLLAAIQKFARKRSGDRAPVCLFSVFDDAELLLSGTLRQQQIQIERADADGIPMVLADRGQIISVAVNLLLNSAQAMAELKPAERKIGVEIRSKDAKFVEVAVRDQGVGVSPEFAEKVFEKFHTTKKDGLGLGLAFSRRYVELHGGKLWCEPGNQSVFRFTLPTASAEVESTAITKDETFG